MAINKSVFDLLIGIASLYLDIWPHEHVSSIKNTKRRARSTN
ncbi:hypothetical protein WDC_0038 [Paucilactobacillus wasatchensis]|uniref:Uncharacterized protein n=1 Tax=Paucilactobacillus wasatchensis TaxID=1335616 RepID=A0A0D1ACA1_9LACO|nr:hypothetical protein WDC_0038 [Paucilactobacillus wasatchensis]